MALLSLLSMTKTLSTQGGNGASCDPTPAKDASLLAEQVTEFRAADDDLLLEQNLTRSNSTPSESNYDVNANTKGCPCHNNEASPYLPTMGGNGRIKFTHKFNAASTALIEEIGGLPALEEMTTHFYNNAFLDATLDKFLRSHDDPHADRFARWIHQKLTGSSVWDEEGESRSHSPVTVANGRTIVVHDRSSAHVVAWHSPKRPQNEVGRRFQLDEYRVWMRLHFWAMREVLGDTSPAFTDYYIRFIGHFVNVYEGTAPMFARESAR